MQNLSLTQENHALKKQLNENSKSLSTNKASAQFVPCNHLEEIRKLEDLKAKEKVHYENHIARQDQVIDKLNKDIKKQHDQID